MVCTPENTNILFFSCKTPISVHILVTARQKSLGQYIVIRFFTLDIKKFVLVWLLLKTNVKMALPK